MAPKSVARARTIESDGSIDASAQNPPGNWHRFDCPKADASPFRGMGGMHNDAAVQGLSEAPFMKDVFACGKYSRSARALEMPCYRSRKPTKG